MRKLADSSRFGLFLMCLNSLYKIILCLMRRFVTHNDKVNAPIAGFFAALTCIFEVKSRRQLLTVLMMSRAIAMGIQSGETNEIIPKVKNKGIWLWVITNVIM